VPFRTLRETEAHILPRVLRKFAASASADAAKYVELFFQVTTRIELYPETRRVLDALAPVRSAIVSNADHEHVAAWDFTLPVEFMLISEAVRAYKPHRLVFTWGWEGKESAVPPGSTRVEVTLEPEGAGGTRLALTHSGLPEPSEIGHDAGWVHYLARLGVAAAKGDPGPDPLGTLETKHGSKSGAS